MDDNVSMVVPQGNKALDKKKAVEELITKTIQQAVENKDPEPAFLLGSDFIFGGYLSKFGLARLAYELRKVWPEFGVDVEFGDVARQYWNFDEDINREVLNRYIRIYEYRDSGEIPEEYAEDYANMNLKDQSPIATAWASGFEITTEHWDKLTNAPDNGTVLKILREDVKGVPARKSSLTLSMTRKGDLYAWNSRGERKNLGWLNVTDMEEDEDVKKAITRILNDAGIRTE